MNEDAEMRASGIVPPTDGDGGAVRSATLDSRRVSSPNRRAWRRFCQNRVALVCAIYLSVIVLIVLIGPLISPYRPLATSDAQFQPPSWAHWCGTDVHGRDLLARMFYGARISLLVGLAGASVSLVIGVLWGSVAGYAGGRWDEVLMRFVDVLYSLPSIIFVIVLITTLEGFLNKWNSPWLEASDFKDAAGVLVALRNGSDPVSRQVRPRLTTSFLESLASYTGAQPPAESLVRGLARELNKMLDEPGSFDGVDLKQVHARGKTRRLWRQKPEGAALVRLNRLLLEDAYPGQIARRETWWTATVSSLFSPKWGATTEMLFLFIGLGAVSWLTMARIVRGQVMSLRARQFVEASRALGASHARILLRHILPNVSGVIIVYLMLTVPSVVLYESFLSYLGLGIKPPQASLGSLIAEGAAEINPIRIYWWMMVCPAFLLASTLLALNLLGDGLRDALDPRIDRP
jgi:ABC-type dipeptide/oligopeptide/nickel transport system permease subunit